MHFTLIYCRKNVAVHYCKTVPLFFLGRKLGAWPVWATSSMCWWGRTDSSRLFRALRSPALQPTATAAVGLHPYSSCNSCNNRPPHRYTVTAAGPKGIHREWKGVVGRWGPGYSVPDLESQNSRNQIEGSGSIHMANGSGSGSIGFTYFWASGSGSISQMYGSECGSFNLIPTVL